MPTGQSRYWRLDLSPEKVVSGNRRIPRNAVTNWSPKKIFAQDDLYSTRWGEQINTEIEQFFFGEIDKLGRNAALFFRSFNGSEISEGAVQNLLTYMSVQKLRTPKGLAHIETLTRNNDRTITLLLMQRIRDLYCAVWTECIWQIVSGEQSPTKFIVSDHPVTVYNRACPPLSKSCRGSNDPDVRWHASHVFFPLSMDKALVLTNLSWARNPYQNEIRARPNPAYFRPSMFDFGKIQIDRMLNENEVLQMNYVTKKRAWRYIAAAEKNWLYPERYLENPIWKKLGDGWLFMPEPRLLNLGGQIVVGYDNGRSEAFSEYGHRPWQSGYEDAQRHRIESESLLRFKAEWAMKFGREYVAHAHQFGRVRSGTDSDEMTERYAAIAQRYRGRNRSRR